MPGAGPSRRPDAALVELAGGLAPGRALDVACGPGRNSLWLAQNGWEVVAVDRSEVSLTHLRGLASGAQVTTVTSDMVEYLLEADLFDLLVLANIHPAPALRDELFALAARAVAPGGHLYAAGQHRDAFGRGGPDDPERLYTEAVLRNAFAGLEVLRLERREGGREIMIWAARS